MKFTNTYFLRSFLYALYPSYIPKKPITLIIWLIRLLPIRVTNLVSLLLVREWECLSESNLAEFLSRLIFEYLTYLFTFSFWCFFIYYLPIYFTWLLIFILPFYLINLFYSYVTLISFLIKIFWLKFSGDVFYDFTFDLRRDMTEHPRNLLDCYLTIKSGLYFACIHDFFIIWEYFVTSKHTLVWFLQTVLVFVYWHYKLLTSTFIFIVKNPILLIYWLWGLKCGYWGLCEKPDAYWSYSGRDRMVYFTWLVNRWAYGYRYGLDINTNITLYSFPYNTSLLLFSKLREVQVLYVDKSILLIHNLNFKSLKILTVPQQFSLKTYVYNAQQNYHQEPCYSLYRFTRTPFTLTRNNFLGFKVLLSETLMLDDCSPTPLPYKVSNNKKVYIRNYDDPRNTGYLRIFNLRFNYSLLNIFKLYLKEVLILLTVTLKLANFVLVLNRDKCISWSNQEIDPLVDNIELLIYDKERYYLRQPSFIEGIQYIFGSNTTLTSQTYYKPRSNQEFSIIFAEPGDLLRFLNYQIDYSHNAPLIEDYYKGI